jgi:hypothetical protein
MVKCCNKAEYNVPTENCEVWHSQFFNWKFEAKPMLAWEVMTAWWLIEYWISKKLGGKKELVPRSNTVVRAGLKVSDKPKFYESLEIVERVRAVVCKFIFYLDLTVVLE